MKAPYRGGFYLQVLLDFRYGAFLLTKTCNMNHKYGLSLIALVSIFVIPIFQAQADVPASCMGYYQATLRSSALSSQTGGVSNQNGPILAQQQLDQCEQSYYASQNSQQSTYSTNSSANYSVNPTWGYVVGADSSCGYYTIYDSNKEYDILKWTSGVFPAEKDTLNGNISPQYQYNYLGDGMWSSNSMTTLSDLTSSQAATDYISLCPQMVSPTPQPVEPVKTYVNSKGQIDMSPTYERYAGATAQCKDETYSYSDNRSGTCSGHKGVKTWY